MLLQILLVLGAIGCALGAILASRLLVSALWLAGTSALVSILIYMLGAPQVAVVELSVGAGLVTVLFVFAINIAGEEAVDVRALLPKPLAWVLVGLSVVLLGWMGLPGAASLAQINLAPSVSAAVSFTDTLWQVRGLDILIQIVLIFAGVLGVLGLLSDAQGVSKEAHS